MKRIHYLIAVVACLAMAFTLTAQDKYFKEALKAGRHETGLYQAIIKGNKKVTLQQIQEKCKKYNYVLVDYSNKSIERFGDTQTCVGSFRFLPQNEVMSYVFSCLKFPNSTKFSDTMQEALALLPLAFPIKKMEPRQMYWSGNVVNGKADGNGYGYGFGDEGTRQVFCFMGVLKNGIPQGKVYVKVAEINNLADIKGVNNTFTVNPLSDGMYLFEETRQFGYFDPYGTCIPAKEYQYASDFCDGQAIVSMPRTQFGGKSSYRDYPLASIAGTNIEFAIDKRGNFVDFSNGQKLAFDNKIAAIEEQKEKERLAELERQRQAKIERERQEQARIAEEKRIKQQQAKEERRRKAEEAKKTYHKTPKRETCIGCWGKGFYTTQVFNDDLGIWHDKTSICILCNGRGYTETHYY